MLRDPPTASYAGAVRVRPTREKYLPSRNR